MASQTSDQTAGDTDRVSFELERLAFDDQRRLVVSGRWFGVRGRRFVRPTLTLTMRADGAEQRALADLEHKPWAADEGDPWLAAFPLDAELKDAAQLELAVAPDIAVELPQSRGTAAHATQCAGRPKHGPRAFAQTPSKPARRPSTRRTSWSGYATSWRRPSAQRSVSTPGAKKPVRRSRTSARRRANCAQSSAACGRSWTSPRRPAASSLPHRRNSTGSGPQARESDRQLQATIRALDQQRAESERLRMRLTAAEATIDRLTRSHETSERAERSEHEAAIAAHAPPPSRRRSIRGCASRSARRCPWPTLRVRTRRSGRNRSPGRSRPRDADTHGPTRTTPPCGHRTRRCARGPAGRCGCSP